MTIAQLLTSVVLLTTMGCASAESEEQRAKDKEMHNRLLQRMDSLEETVWHLKQRIEADSMRIRALEIGQLRDAVLRSTTP